MRDRDERNIAQIRENEQNPQTDRQNLEPEPAGEAMVDSVPAGFDDDVVESNPRSDIEDYVRDEKQDAPTLEEATQNSDDDDPWGDGTTDTPLNKRYEDMADRDDLARRVEELVADAYDWSARSEEEDAQEIYETLLDVAERLGNPPEETIHTQPGRTMPEDTSKADTGRS